MDGMELNVFERLMAVIELTTMVGEVPIRQNVNAPLVEAYMLESAEVGKMCLLKQVTLQD